MNSQALRTMISHLNNVIDGMEGHHTPNSYNGRKLAELKQERLNYSAQLRQVNASSGASFSKEEIEMKVLEILSRGYKRPKIQKMTTTPIRNQVGVLVEFTHKSGFFRKKERESLMI